MNFKCVERIGRVSSANKALIKRAFDASMRQINERERKNGPEKEKKTARVGRLFQQLHADVDPQKARFMLLWIVRRVANGPKSAFLYMRTYRRSFPQPVRERCRQQTARAGARNAEREPDFSLFSGSAGTRSRHPAEIGRVKEKKKDQLAAAANEKGTRGVEK